jgi:ribosomal protein S12 methylthiotransferase accessory factor
MRRGNGAGALLSHTEKGMPVAVDSLLENPELLKRFGITRLCDVTGLDTLGVPVWAAVQPNSRSLSVSQGKGLDTRQAKISAVMEAVENAVAEDTQRHIREHGSIAAMLQRGMRLVPLEELARVNPGELDPDRGRAWVAGYSARDGGIVHAPFELIGMDFRADFPWDRQAFQMSSQGIAAGTDPDRTILHALLELVEHDASFAAGAFETRRIGMRRIAFSQSRHEALDTLLGLLEKVGLEVRFYDMTSSNGLPVVLAAIPRAVAADHGPGLRISAGTACRLTLQDAATAALLEAIQSRLTDISGARDDLSAQRYVFDRAAEEWSGPGQALPSGSLAVPIDIGDEDAEGPVWRRVADHLFTAGVDDIFIFPLDTGMPGISVVRVLASGLAAAGGSLNRFSASALDSFLKR